MIGTVLRLGLVSPRRLLYPTSGVLTESSTWFLATAFLAGVALRVLPLAGSTYPPNDGALFVGILEAVQASGFWVPPYVEYNGTSLPLAYPPLGFLLGAALAKSLGIGSLGAATLLPTLVSIAALPVAYWTLRQLLPSRIHAVVAFSVFSLMPRSYVWAIAGGGITRSLGLFLAVAFVGVLAGSYKQPARTRTVAAGLLLGLTALSHPQAAVFGAMSALVLLLFLAQDKRRGAAQLVACYVLAALTATPWLLAVVAQHGPTPWLSASQTGGSWLQGIATLLTFRFSGGQFEILGVVGGFGLIACMVQRVWLFPLWVAVTITFDPRAGLTYASLPLAGASAYGVVAFIRLLGRARIPRWLAFGKRMRVTAAFLALLLFTTDAYLAHLDPDSVTESLSAEEVAAMEWARDHADPNATFLVVSGDPWPTDKLAEWFPLVGQRRSSSTVQGTEWLSNGAFSVAEYRHQWMIECALRQATDCVGEWELHVEDIDYLLLARHDDETVNCCFQVANLSDTRAHEVYQSANIRIFKLTDSP